VKISVPVLRVPFSDVADKSILANSSAPAAGSVDLSGLLESKFVEFVTDLDIAGNGLGNATAPLSPGRQATSSPTRFTMNRILTLGVVALGLILGSQQQASAWCNFKFGAGINWDYQGGNNCFGWGLFHSGEVPGPEVFGCGPCPGGCPSPYMNYGGGPGPDFHAGYGAVPGAAYAGGQMNYPGANYGAPGAQGAYANGPQQNPQTPAAATGNTPQKNPATTIPNYQSSNGSPYQPTSNAAANPGANQGGYPMNYPGAYYQGGYQGGYPGGYNPYWSNSYYGGGYNYGMQPGYNGWNWNTQQR
jgi:hypothetical protein